MNGRNIIYQILSDNDNFLRKIKELKEKAPTYPEILIEDNGSIIWATSMVEFIFNGIKFKRHHVNSIHPNKDVGIKELKEVLKEEAKKTIKMGMPCNFDEIVGIVKNLENERIL